ncbi:MAG: dTDP-4-dehydrorhamnose reductase [Bacteroidetes bacterium]|nr:dTDP-4-dehydrorhamnose reductase [Bacteroidota bacterium]
MTPKTIAIIGAGSKTAKALAALLLEETDAELHLFTSRTHVNTEPRIHVHSIDILDRTALKEPLLAILPDVVINTAAMTNVDACETDRGQAWAVNVTLVEHLARVCRVIDARLIHYSTDYVFDGTKGPYAETDVPRPINYYGKSKLAGENVCLGSGIPAAIIRTNVVYGPEPDSTDFVKWLLKSLDEGQTVKVVNDQFSNPTLVDDLALATLRIITKDRTGIYHVGGADYLNRYDFALRIAETFKISNPKIEPISTESLKQPAKRPLRGGLVTLKAESDLGLKFAGINSGLVTVRHKLMAEHTSARKPL